MAPNATLYHLHVDLSDVDRDVYRVLELRLARHPSESQRYLVTRALAYCLSYEAGIAFSKGGVSSADEPPVLVRDDTGNLLAWIDVGSPSAERLHKASKAARRVALFTQLDLNLLRREAAAGAVHRAEAIDVWTFPKSFIDGLESLFGKNTALSLVRTEDQLYATIGKTSLEGSLAHSMLSDPIAVEG